MAVLTITNLKTVAWNGRHRKITCLATKGSAIATDDNITASSIGLRQISSFAIQPSDVYAGSIGTTLGAILATTKSSINLAVATANTTATLNVTAWGN